MYLFLLDGWHLQDVLHYLCGALLANKVSKIQKVGKEKNHKSMGSCVHLLLAAAFTLLISGRPME